MIGLTLTAGLVTGFCIGLAVQFGWLFWLGIFAGIGTGIGGIALLWGVMKIFGGVDDG